MTTSTVARVLFAVVLALLAVACEPDWGALTCGYNEVESGVAVVPEGECWRARALHEDVRITTGSCDEGAVCLTARAGEVLTPLVSTMHSPGITNEAYEILSWDCEALETACGDVQ
jgi:hypothetical protein